MAYEALRVIRPFVKVGSRIAPRFAGNLAFRAFCLPPRQDGSAAAQKRLLDRAEARLGSAENHRVAFPGGEIQVYHHKTTVSACRGRVLLLHGWSSRAAFMTGFVEPLLARGFDVVLLDLPGHGRSAGRSLHIPLGVAAVHAVKKRLGPFFAIIAHSFGGALATALVAGAVKGFPALSVERLVLVATPHSMPQIFRWFGDIVGLSSRGQYWLEHNVLALAGQALSKFEGKDFLEQAKVSTLVIHAPDDKEVSFRSAEILTSAGDNVSLLSLSGLGHRRILYASDTIAAATDFLT